MQNEIEQLRAEMDELKQLIYFNHLSDDAIVSAEYVAKMFDCSTDAVIRRRFGTHKIKRIREKPVGFRKGDVHQVLRDLAKPLTIRAAEERAKARKVTRKVKR